MRAKAAGHTDDTEGRGRQATWQIFQSQPAGVGNHVHLPDLPITELPITDYLIGGSRITRKARRRGGSEGLLVVWSFGHWSLGPSPALLPALPGAVDSPGGAPMLPA